MAIRTNLSLLSTALLLVATLTGPAARADHHGREIFELCSQCHGEAGGGDRMFLAPAIAGFSQWYVENQLKKFRGGVRGLHPDDVGGLRMHPMSLSLKTDEDITAVAAYVASLPPTWPAPVLAGGDAAAGKGLYTPCTACHGPQAEGNQALNGPNLKVTNDWYLLTQLDHFKEGIRGTNPKDTFGGLMRSMAMTLTDEQAMKDVIAYIMTLADGRQP